MSVVKSAIIKDGWIMCPICGKRQFKVEANTTIIDLKFRCRSSRKSNEHFMLVNYGGK